MRSPTSIQNFDFYTLVRYLQGPQGPKTLCNACGLRWAKSVRTTSTSAGEGDPSTEIQAATASEL